MRHRPVVSQDGRDRCLVGSAAERRPPVDAATEAFLAHRNLLFTVAYEMLGSAADAEDVLQETWLRWAGVDLGTVHDQRAYLVTITTRQALTRLRTLGRRKESYVGPWLPEPLLTTPDVAADAELAEAVSMAMLLVLETLTPAERAVQAGDRNRRPARPARHPRARRRPADRRRRGAGRAGARRRGRHGGCGAGQDRVRGRAAAGIRQRLPGADYPAQRRDRHRDRGTNRQRPDHRAVRGAQSGEAVAYGAGNHLGPLTLRARG